MDTFTLPPEIQLVNLADAILRILDGERDFPPLSAESLSRVLFYTGHGQTVDPIPVTVIEGALSDLMAAGMVERVHSRRLGARFRIMKSVQAGHVKKSISEQVAE